MKIAFVTAFPEEPTRPNGGVESVSVNLVRALAQLDDLDVHVVTTARTNLSFQKTVWARATIHRLPWVGGRPPEADLE